MAELFLKGVWSFTIFFYTATRRFQKYEVTLLEESEACEALNITLNAANNLPWRSGWKLLGPVQI